MSECVNFCKAKRAGFGREGNLPAVWKDRPVEQPQRERTRRVRVEPGAVRERGGGLYGEMFLDKELQGAELDDDCCLKLD
jgi:hypothetical protein